MAHFEELQSRDSLGGSTGRVDGSFERRFEGREGWRETGALAARMVRVRRASTVSTGGSGSRRALCGLGPLRGGVLLGVVVGCARAVVPVVAFGLPAAGQESALAGIPVVSAILEEHEDLVHSEERSMIAVTDAELVGQLTGPGSPNETAARWDVYGTDLGHMFWHRDQLYMVFGDTFGEGGMGGENWRSNTLARLADPHPREGLRIEAMITGPEGKAKELIPSRKIDGVEKTVIPTNGISINGRMYLHYMSVSRWGGGTGRWEVGHSGLAYSDDDGQTWTVPESAIWPGGTGFEQVALLRDSSYVYMLGIPGGRFGGVRLRRVAPGRMLDRGAYEYWDGQGWSADPAAAEVVVPSPVGELSVAWNALHQRWMMMYLNAERRAVMLRMAPELTGPWGPEQVVVQSKRDRRYYAPYIVPLNELGGDVFFTLSRWHQYNVFLMRMKLEPQPSSQVAEAEAAAEAEDPS